MTSIPVSSRRHPLAPNALERVLSAGAVLMLAAVLGALLRGHAEWAKVPVLIWLHLVTIIVALALTPILLLNPRGNRRHRQIGYVWVVAMAGTAALTFGIRTKGGFSPIHLLSAFTLLQVPLLAWYAHTHRIVAHRRTVQFLVAGALLIAGFFTFPFGRMLGRWLLA